MIATSANKIHFRFLLLALLFLSLGNSSVAASLSEKQARKLISTIAGAQLRSGAVRIKSIAETSSGADVTAEIETAFRLHQGEQHLWHVAEVRMGPDRWEEIPAIVAASSRKLTEVRCAAPDLAKARVEVVSVKRARCLIASLLGIELPSDAVRVRSISSLGLPLTSRPSALVVALVQLDFRFSRGDGGWRISGLRTGNRDWFSIDATVAAINEEKRKRAQKDLESLERAVKAFHKDTGFYVLSDKHPALIDHLSPRYLAPIIRVDPWGNPYRYQGERDRYQLRSDGPDGRENTPDDLVVTGFAQKVQNPTHSSGMV